MKKRVDYLDIVRGICIIYMIVGHIGFQWSDFDYYIHAFHMPLFFLISGIFFKKIESFPNYIKKMSKKLLFPYYFWGFFILIVDKTTIGTQIGFKNGLRILFTTNNDLIPIAGALWFLTSFFLSHVLFSVMQTYLKNEKIKYLICIVVTIIGAYLYKITNINLWWSANSALVGIGLMEIGYLLKIKTIQEKLVINNNFILFLFILINTVLIMKTGYVNMRTNNYPNILLFLLNVILSVITYINIAKKLEKYKYVANWLKLLGKESIFSLCLNQIIILLFSVTSDKLFFSLLKTYHIALIIKLIILVLSLTTITFLIKLLKDSKLKILFGK